MHEGRGAGPYRSQAQIADDFQGEALVEPIEGDEVFEPVVSRSASGAVYEGERALREWLIGWACLAFLGLAFGIFAGFTFLSEGEPRVHFVESETHGR